MQSYQALHTLYHGNMATGAAIPVNVPATAARRRRRQYVAADVVLAHRGELRWVRVRRRWHHAYLHGTSARQLAERDVAGAAAGRHGAEAVEWSAVCAASARPSG